MVGMGPWRRLREWFGGRSDQPPSPERREAAERRELEGLQREIDKVHGQLRETLSRLSSDGGKPLPSRFVALEEELGSTPPRFATPDEAREYMTRMRALLRG